MATPREVRIDLSCPFPYRAGADFLSTIAYPHPAHGTLRDLFCRSLCRWQVVKRALEDQDYATRAQLIPPVIFADEYGRFWKAVEGGIEKLHERMVATLCVAVPYLGDLKVSGQEPRVKKLSEIGAQSLGWSPKSGSNFISDVWTDTKPVVHATLAWLIWHVGSIPERLIKLTEQIPDTFNPETFEEHLRNTVSWNFEEYLQDPLSLGPIIDTAEQILPQLLPIKRDGKLVFRAEAMVKFSKVMATGTVAN
jgi:hypothetical protein